LIGGNPPLGTHSKLGAGKAVPKGLPEPLAGKSSPESVPTEDLPARSTRVTGNSPAELPSLPRRKPPPPVRPTSALESDLPAALAPRAKPQAPRVPAPDSPSAPRPARAEPPPATKRDDTWALPELAKEPPLVAPATLSSQDYDLDTPGQPKISARPNSAVPRSIDVDLPLARPTKQGLASKEQSAKVQDDLEIDLPSPFEAMAENRRDDTANGDFFDLDLPSPAADAALPSARADLPTIPKSKLPALSAGRAALSATTKKRFGEIDLLPDIDPAGDSRLPTLAQRNLSSSSDLIPDLDAPLGVEARSASSGKDYSTVDVSLEIGGPKLPDLTDALPIDSAPPIPFSQGSQRPAPATSVRPPQTGLEFGELNLNSGDDSVDSPRNVSNTAPSIVRQSGGGTDFGEVSLDAGGGAESAIGTIDDAGLPREKPAATDLEFGGIPQEAAGAATGKVELGKTEPKGAAATRARHVGPQKAANRTSRRGLRIAAIVFLVLLVIGGAALSLVPDMGLFGYAFISDQLRKSEYERILTEQVASSQRALLNDTYPEAIRALQNLEQVQRSHPRARGLRAYLGFIGYAVDLRFGASPERSSKSKVMLDQLIGKNGVDDYELALAARAAAEGNLARAHQKIDEIRRSEPKRIETFVLSAQIEMLDRRPGQALVYWRQVEATEHSARSAYGSATAEMALGQVEAAERSATTAMSRQPIHVGARLLLARIAMDKRGNAKGAETIIAETLKHQNDASPSERVATQTLLGDLNLARSKISNAETAYTQALAFDPRSSAALRGLGEALFRAGRYAEALARFEAAVQADPDDTTAAVGVAKTQLSLERVREAAALLLKLKATHSQSYLVNYWYGAALEAMGNRDEAEKVFSSAVALGGTEPGAIDAYISLALLKNQQGRREEAQKLLDAARQKLPLSPKILIAIGQLSLSEGRYEAAISDFRHALKLDPTDIAATFRLGVALRKNRQFDEAMSSFDDVAKVDHEYPGLALERGLLYETSGRTEEALKSFEDALAKAPSDADLMLRVGCGKVAAGRPKEAEALLRKVLEQRPMSAETHHCLGRAQLLEGTNLALALRTLERAVELDPYRPEYYLYVGWAANEAGRISVAEQALKKALALDQGLGDAYWQRGVLRFRQGAIKDAVVDLTKAIELRPSRHEAHAALAEAYYELGSELKALEQWRVAVQAQPDNAAWHFSYGKLLQAASRDAEARGELEKALQLGSRQDPPPRWTWEAHRLLARSLGFQPSAVPHWQEFLRLAPLDNAYRDEAKQTLARLGQPWEESGK
jgi:tetratricopeptide (TPR) repeat protein